MFLKDKVYLDCPCARLDRGSRGAAGDKGDDTATKGRRRGLTWHAADGAMDARGPRLMPDVRHTKRRTSCSSSCASHNVT